MKTYVIISIIVEYQDKILLLKRTAKRRFAAGKWEGVSGYVQEHESIEDAAEREVYEETQLKGEVRKIGKPLWIKEDNQIWITIPVLFKAQNSLPRGGKQDLGLDEEEHDGYQWADPKNIDEFFTVEDFDKVIDALL